MEIMGHGDQGHGDEVVFHSWHHDLILHSREKRVKKAEMCSGGYQSVWVTVRWLLVLLLLGSDLQRKK
ncbi:hypothetical protein NL676_034788 [Syzygium grande]|nr:hypothetical protein NL676_034788 [Syzygium grande]